MGSAVAMATAIDPQRLQLTQAQRKALNDRMVGLGRVGAGKDGRLETGDHLHPLSCT